MDVSRLAGPLPRDVWIRDVLLVPKVVQLRASPLVRDLRERSIEVRDLSRPIRLGASAQEAPPVERRDNWIEQAPLGLITDTGEKSVPHFQIVAEIASPIRRGQMDVVIRRKSWAR